MGGICGGARAGTSSGCCGPSYGTGAGYGASTGCCGPSHTGYGASTGCCGCGGQPAYPYGVPQYVQPVQPMMTSQVVAAPVTEIIETVSTPTQFYAPAPQIISAPQPIFNQQPMLGPGTVVSGPVPVGPPISVPSAHTIGMGPPMGAPIGVGGFGGQFGGPVGFGGPIGGFGGQNFGRTSIITGGPVIGGPMLGSPIRGGFTGGFPGGAVTTTTTGGIGLPGAGFGFPGGAIRY